MIMLLLALAAPNPVAMVEPFEIAITVDDLPGQGPLPLGMTRAGVAEASLRPLTKHAVPEAYGFVNGAKLNRDKDGNDALAQWTNAGYPLGNHGFTHLNLNAASSLSAWKADVIAGQRTVDRASPNAMRVYRFPNLSSWPAAGLADTEIGSIRLHQLPVRNLWG
jgi:peptidoglycan/xylan/chitin deacetylase (PgdA/CDA1 family)